MLGKAMSIMVLVTVTLGASMAAHGAAPRHGVQTEVDCQQNMDDGRILVDGTFVPIGARYRVLQYQPNRKESGWSYGRCLIEYTAGVKD